MMMSKKESYMYFLNNDEDLLKDRVPIKSFYDPSDSTGIHLSVKRASVLEENIQSFFDSGEASGFDIETERRLVSILKHHRVENGIVS